MSDACGAKLRREDLVGSLLDVSPVVPVVVIEEAATAVPLADALWAGGVRIIEITLRSAAALEAVRAIADERPQMAVGVGTVCAPAQALAAREAGASFLVSPGSTDRLLDAMQDTGLPFLAGCATPSDMLRLLERGITEAKLFPATAVGGTALLKAVHGPLPQLRFCPTGGITVASAPEFLALPNVGCVGGTWLTPAAALASGDWPLIAALAEQASALRVG
ncbi:MAG TPA: bifunctional 4-hydroxy-2-oxoglutarate aldolase/2-dehydro-3-deoxy-phosphogluconate aldolase [Jatrophihabitans sp.]|jgi:2-dehydro-3-deoxyphosphogluconate aldolase/(4S)-4-hydroxy-2-oxoglutarate aldolase|uniref:bifunctional 4-hydroxy-2-oxoglutarate aldolase/2-dehydro-3-deoxy-phosphogluconate aldolase n=1 Tax=Jatrophihabitans sp. TaxID=1932789 RepID=UPI002DFF465A|nr:bifunctional 4-hydroxy-2-oxoglutarate aldolase/2-dehydro-3-deoxy-phosphogluconate aldolase [Jatrophihabitans sp.]